MATSTISHTHVAGAALDGVRVIARLVPRPGFREDSGAEVDAYQETTYSGGTWSLALERQSNILPEGSTWEIEQLIPESQGGNVVLRISVPDNDSTLYACLADPLDGTPLSLYLTRALASSLYGTAPLTTLFNVKDAAYGAVGNGTTDDTAAIALAFAAAAAAGGGIVLFPGGNTFLVSSTLNPGSNIQLWGGPNARILAKDQNWTAGVLRLNNTTNNLITGLTVDGNKDAAGGVDNKVLGLEIRGGSKHTIRDSIFKNCPGIDATGTTNGDGIYIARDGSGNIPTRITLDNVTCDGNVRQGMSVISVSGLKALNSYFVNTTGDDPGSGVDFEPNAAADTIEDVEFVNCNFTGNFRGITSSASAGATMRNLKITDGLCADNDDRGMFLDGFTNSRVRGVMVRGNGVNGIEFSSGFLNKVNECEVTDNDEIGISVKGRGSEVTNSTVYLNGHHGIVLNYVSGVPSGYRCIGNASFNNSTATNNTYDGINHTGNASHEAQGSIIADNQTINDSDYGAVLRQRYGIRLDASVKQCQLIGNRAIGNLTDDISVVEVDENLELNLTVLSGGLRLARGFIHMTERTAPSAPNANAVLVYAVDDAAKTELTSRFGSGVAQEITQEP